MDYKTQAEIVNNVLMSLDKAKEELSQIENNVQVPKFINSIEVVREYGLRIWCDLYCAERDAGKIEAAEV